MNSAAAWTVTREATPGRDYPAVLGRMKALACPKYKEPGAIPGCATYEKA